MWINKLQYQVIVWIGELKIDDYNQKMNEN